MGKKSRKKLQSDVGAKVEHFNSFPSNDSESIAVGDGFTNGLLGLGLGADNLFSDTQYSKTNMLSWDRETLDSAYRQNWIVGKVVDIIAEDATREWISITGDYSPEEIAAIEKQAERLRL